MSMKAGVEAVVRPVVVVAVVIVVVVAVHFSRVEVVESDSMCRWRVVFETAVVADRR